MPSNPGSILLTLIQGEDGHQWAKDKKGWNSFTVDPVCSWDGVFCDEKTGKVVEAIVLQKTGIPGTIPTELGLLTDLKAITITEGKLRGTIPKEIAALPHLEKIILPQNKLTGTLPFFQSPSLRSLDLGYNKLTGTLMPDLCHKKNKMTDFDVIHNKLSGPIPSCFSLMGSLVTLSLSENRFSGLIPSSLGNLIVLEYLYLDHNFLIGFIPPAIARVDSNLRELWLQENLLSGTIPASLADISNLKDFYIDGNKFTGSVPNDLCRSEINADFFQSVDPNIDRDYCQSIACPVNMVSVEGVYPCVPCSAKYYNPYLGRIGKCTTLNQREILQDLYDSAGGTMWIGASNWAIKDEFICDFVGITCDANNHITSIDLKGRGLTGTIPASIGFLKYLSKLDLSDNNLTGYLPSDLRWAPLQTLDVSGNRLRGLVPNTLCLKTYINGNGEYGDYNCDNIVCPIGYFSANGYATENNRCIKCSDSGAEYLGLKSCHRYAISQVVGGNKGLTATFFILGIISTIVYTAIFILQKKRQERGYEFEITSVTSKSEHGPNTAPQMESNEKISIIDDYSILSNNGEPNNYESNHDEDVEDDSSVYSSSMYSTSSTRQKLKQQESTTTDWLDVPDI